MSPTDTLKVVEGVSGYYFYHLSEDGRSGHPALCGNKQVMSTCLTTKDWGFVGQLRERYCKKCEEIWKGGKK